jgi:hypothetical protein
MPKIDIIVKHCTLCGVEMHISAEAEAEALAELSRTFGAPVTECDPVCTECYRRVIAWMSLRN